MLLLGVKVIEEMKITNRLKIKLLVLDGIDNDFIEYGKEISCPECDGVIVYSIVNSYEFDTLTEEVKSFLVKKMRGVKLVSEHKKYSYDDSQLDVSKNTCSWSDGVTSRFCRDTVVKSSYRTLIDTVCP